MSTESAKTLLSFLFLFYFSSVAHSQGLEELKSSFTAEINALNARDLADAAALVDEQMVLFGIFSPFPTVGKEEYQEALQEYFDNFPQAALSPIDPKFRVIGSSGVAWGNFRLIVKQKSGKSESSDGRYMFTYLQSGGKWMAMSMHYSLLKPLVR